MYPLGRLFGGSPVIQLWTAHNVLTVSLIAVGMGWACSDNHKDKDLEAKHPEDTGRIGDESEGTIGYLAGAETTVRANQPVTLVNALHDRVELPASPLEGKLSITSFRDGTVPQAKDAANLGTVRAGIEVRLQDSDGRQVYGLATDTPTSIQLTNVHLPSTGLAGIVILGLVDQQDGQSLKLRLDPASISVEGSNVTFATQYPNAIYLVMELSSDASIDNFATYGAPAVAPLQSQPTCEPGATYWIEGLGNGQEAGTVELGGMNNSGTVAGLQRQLTTGTVIRHAAIFDIDGGAPTILPTLGGNFTLGDALNGIGVVVGTASLADETVRAFLYNGSNLQDLGTLGGDNSWAKDINASNTVVGWAEDQTAVIRRAFVYTSADGMRDLGTLGGITSRANAINTAGNIVGTSAISGATPEHAFLYTAGTMSDLGTLGGSRSEAFDINDAGSIVGVAETADGTSKAFLYEDNVMKDLGALGRTGSQANAINKDGIIVGTSDNVGPKAFIYQDGKMVDLNTLIKPPPSLTGLWWLLTEAVDINDAGMILGLGLGPGYQRAFRLTVCPQPSSSSAP